jgi:hypothetical protein
MKAISRHKNITIIEFDLTAPIKPTVGLGGLSFTQTIKDFQGLLTNKSFEKDSIDNFNYTLDSKYFYLTITTKNKEIQIEIELFSGNINSIACNSGYKGKLVNDIGIGTPIKEMLAKDDNFGFNLDTDWFDRTPFDGLIIYPPIHLLDKCIDAAVSGSDYPDFYIETIELIDLDFAKEHFPEGQLTFEKG